MIREKNPMNSQRLEIVPMTYKPEFKTSSFISNEVEYSKHFVSLEEKKNYL